VIDCHVHLSSLAEIESLEAIRRCVGSERMNIVCVFGRDNVNANPPAFAAKAEYPDRFYVFAGLDHSAYFSSGAIRTPSLAEQVDRLIALGADGVKMLENKPTHRKLIDIPVDGPYFEEYFARLEETGFPVLWHVCDPEEFWDPDRTPRWAKERGWGYDDSFVPKERLYSEVETVMKRHPRLKVIFAHFYFLSADLPRAAGFLDRFEGVHFDLAPGVEFLYNLSKDPVAAREFFVKYSDRIVFGTDISSSQSPAEALTRARIVTRWLETTDEYRVPDEADFLLGPPEDGVIRGLGLPEHALDRIYRENFERLAGPRPRPLDRDLAAEECERIAREIAVLRDVPPESTHARAAAERLRSPV
jgi:predicted TIM-barrel fold metal-dependent hydrolase